VLQLAKLIILSDFNADLGESTPFGKASVAYFRMVVRRKPIESLSSSQTKDMHDVRVNKSNFGAVCITDFRRLYSRLNIVIKHSRCPCGIPAPKCLNVFRLKLLGGHLQTKNSQPLKSMDLNPHDVDTSCLQKNRYTRLPSN